MTQNQIAYHTLKETQRANQAREAETHRANVRKEQQTSDQIAETQRANRATEQLTRKRDANSYETNYMNASANADRNTVSREQLAHTKWNDAQNIGIKQDQLALDEKKFKHQQDVDTAKTINDTIRTGTQLLTSFLPW